jgi:UTP--glucose-1-phosphate uridylyltransferase
LGTRFLPATKAQPKEMLPLVDTPIIQYVVQEAVASGLDHITLVTGRSKRAIEDHFDAAFELEYYLHKRGKTEELAQIEAISELASLALCSPEGTARAWARHPVPGPWSAKNRLESFLADDLIVSPVPCMRQLLNVSSKREGPSWQSCGSGATRSGNME